MKHMRKALGLLLALVMLVGVLPMAALAVEDEEPATDAEAVAEAVDTTEADAEPAEEEELATAEVEADTYMASEMVTITKAKSVPLDTTEFYRIFHLDAGRKYFSVSQIEEIIDMLAENNYTHLELALGNDALRFILDDMAVAANGTTYSSANVTNGIKNGNIAYYNDPNGNYLTESEMDAILAYAKSKNVGVIPLINTPGHMDAIVDCMEAVGISNPAYNNSARTVDVTNAEAVNFTLALVEKYIQYFASKGCTIFNMGCDEYANDKYSSGSMGFGNLISTKNYSSFITFVNNMAAQVQNAGMTAMAFNDGIYFQNNKNFGTFDTSIAIAYWTSGWTNYTVRSAADLVSDGFKIINTNDGWYYVLGRATGGYSLQSAKSAASGTAVTSVSGSSSVTPAGAMMCLWCDTPSAGYTATEKNNVKTLIINLANNNSDYFVSHQPAANTVWDSSNTVSVTAVGVESVAVTEVTASYTADGKLVYGYDITPAGDIQGDVTVTINLPEGMSSSGVQIYDVRESAMVSDAKVTNGVISFTAAHFSEYDVVGNAKSTSEPEYNQEITLNIGESKTETQNDVNNQSNTNTDYYDSFVATVSVTGTDAVAGSRVETAVTSVSSGSSYYIKSSSGQYLNAAGKFVDGIQNAVKWTWDGSKLINGNYYLRYNNGWTISQNSSTTLYFNDGAFYRTRDRSWDWGSFSYIYTYSNPLGSPITLTTTAPVAASTTINFTGINAGTTYYTVGSTTYKIVVKQKAQAVSVLLDATSEVYTDTTASTAAVVSGGEFVTVNITGNSISFTGKAIGTAVVETTNCKYTVTVTDEDLTDVTLTVNLWATNEAVTANGAKTAVIQAADAHTAQGTAIADLVPANAKKDGNDMIFWQLVCHTYGNWQIANGTSDKTGGSTNDMSGTGSAVTYIRYLGGKWSYSADRETWTDITTSGTRTDRLDAYYMQKTDVTDEITTTVKDWGVVPHTGYNSEKYVLIDYSVKYESGEETPSSFPVSGKTVAFHCDPNDSNTVHQYNGGSSSTWSNNYRDMGTVCGVETGDYEIYMITVTATSDIRTTAVATNCKDATSYSYSGTEYVTWAESEDVITQSGLGKYTSISGKYTCKVGGAAEIGGLEIFSCHGMKVTYYVRAKVTEDSLTVKYVDETSGTEFYTYSIVVNKGTAFDVNIGLTGQNVVNGTVTNSLNKTQTVSADLSTMPAIPAAYRYSDYTVTSVVRSDDGKTVTLSYTFNNTHAFVVDFAMPLHLTAADLDISGDWTSATVSGAKYGTATTAKGQGVTYTPTAVMQDVEKLELVLTGDSGAVTHMIYIYPASTVYYGSSFLSESATATTATQTVAAAGNKQDNDLYGYDSAYLSGLLEPAVESTDKGLIKELEFTGTGIDVNATLSNSSGYLVVQILQNGSLKELAIVDTSIQGAYVGGASSAVGAAVYSRTDLDYGTYTVKLFNSKGLSVTLDSFRVYNTLKSASADDVAYEVYKEDNEENPTFYEVRDLAFGAISKDTLADYGVAEDERTLAAVGSQVYSQLENTYSAVITTKDNDAATQQELLEKGPKNELYLIPGATLTIKVSTGREVQLGLKGVSAAATCSINGGVGQTVSVVDMFYPVLDKGASGESTITVKNTGDSVLSVTKLKVSDDPSALGTLTEADLVEALRELGLVEQEVMGDADENGKLSLMDVAKAFQLATENAAVSKYLLKVLDMNGDGKLNIIDVSMIYAKYIGR